MGLFDIFKKKEKEPEIQNGLNEAQKSYEIEYKTTRDGRLQIDFYDKGTKFSQFYDTTRLVVDNRPIMLAGQEVRNCIVSWYSQDDAVFLDSEYEGESLNARDYRGILAQIDPTLLQTDENYCSVVMRKLLDKKRVTKYLEEGLQETPEQPCGKYIGESLNARDYRGILAQIDPTLLQTDENYCSVVMRKLLDKKRVTKYLEEGLQETPEQPCGKYIGGVKLTEKGYGKFFSLPVGRASHNSDLMINRRREHRENIEAKKQREIADKKAQIQQLQSEIDDMSK